MFVTLSIIIRFATTKELGGFSWLLGACCKGIAQLSFSRSAIAILDELDDRALRHIDLGRSQIEAAVYGFVTLRNRGRA
jgi:hypothetical protein